MTKHVVKAQKYLFLALVFLLPSNLAYHLIFPSSYVQGILVDYLIPTFYLTDILIIVMLIIWLWGHKNKLGRLRQVTAKKYLAILFITILICLNIFLASNKIAAGYKWAKLVEFTLLYFYIKSQTFNKKYIRQMIRALCFSIIWQSVLVIIQWFKQAHLFPYPVMGESQFSLATASVKTINWFGRLKVVPMGTFPHPNILAGWLTITLIILITHLTITIYDRKRLKECGRSDMGVGNRWWSKLWHKLQGNLLVWLVLVMGVEALFLSFSLVSWTVFLLALMLISLPKLKLPKINKVIMVGLIAVFGARSLTVWVDPNSWLRRLKLGQIALKMWLSSPLVGVGLNNFTVRMSEFGEIVANIRFFQPVHNIWLLILAETGIVGLGTVIWGLIKLLLKLKLSNPKNLIILALLILSLFDHYLITSQQGMLGLVLLLGLFF